MMRRSQRRIIVVAGEPSGDRLGAQLALELKKHNPTIKIEGVFGSEMINAGCIQLAQMDILSVMGFIDPIKSLPSILRLRSWLLKYILDNPPDLFIGIDAPDFNFRIEHILHNKGITTVHYVSPMVWAWRQGRVKKIKKSVDLMLTLFPFEKSFYKEHEIPVVYVGHPTADIIPLLPNKDAAKKTLNLKLTDPVLAVLPGSRNSEIKHMIPVYLKCLNKCFMQHPRLKIFIALVHAKYEKYIEYYRIKIAPDLKLRYLVGNSHIIMQAADCALTTSGTATLELLFHKTPMIVAYKTNWFNYQLGKLLIKIKYISLPNILANKTIVPEFIQYDANADKLAESLLNILDNENLQRKQTNNFFEIHKQLQQNSSNIAATEIIKLLYYKNNK